MSYSYPHLFFIILMIMEAQNRTEPVGALESSKKSAYAAVKNKSLIADVLGSITKSIQEHNCDTQFNVLEIASGTGEHAASFLDLIPSIKYYQPTDIDISMFESIEAWTVPFSDKAGKPIFFNAASIEEHFTSLPQLYQHKGVDIMICINMIHISPLECTHGLFELANRYLILESTNFFV
jgi:hypothetical protein